MKRTNLITSLILSLALTGCSSFVQDITNLTSEVKYTVKHLQEITAEYDADGNQTNLVADGNGNYIPAYEEFEKEELKGKKGEETKATARTYEGFIAQSFTQSEILEDGSTVVTIRYNRVESTLSFDPNNGAWDYSSAKTDTGVKTFTRKYGSAVPADLASDLGKRFCKLAGWKSESGEVIAAIPQTFPVKSAAYKAEWEQTGGVAFKIRYMFENLDGTGYDYEEAQDEVQYALAGETTVVHIVPDGSENEIIAKSDFAGFAAASIVQQTVVEDGSAIVEVYFDRVLVDITLSIGEGSWNYKTVKADPSVEEDKADKTVTVKAGTAFDKSILTDAGKKSSGISRWQLNGGDDYVDDLPEYYPLISTAYTAQWSNSAEASYFVEHWFEKTDCPDASVETEANYEKDDSLTVKKYGLPESNTTAEAVTKTGFSAKEIKQQEIALNGGTTVKVYYERVLVDVTLSIGDGSWNYKIVKADPSVEEDKADKTVTVKAGTAFDKSVLADVGKKSNGISKWQLNGGDDYVDDLPDYYPLVSTSYMALWSNSAESPYYVEHWFENTDCSDVSVETEDNYTRDDNLTVKKYGLPESNTTAEAVTKNGFSAKEIKQQEIELSGTTTVRIYYVRNSIDLKFSGDDGLWNYDDYKNGDAPDSADKIISGKYGTTVSYAKVSNFANLKKVGKNLTGFSDGENKYSLEELPSVFPETSAEFTAVWKDKAQVSYTVIHMTEKVSSSDDSDPSNYEEESRDTTKKGTPDYYTEAAAKTIDGFEAKPVTQEEILEDGNTEVRVYYKRLSYKVTFKANGGFWNYDKYKNNGEAGDADDRVVEGKFGADIDIENIDFDALKKTSHDFDGWTKDGGTKVFKADEILKQYPAADVVYSAAWKEGSGIKYTVKHLFENLSGSFVEDESLRQTGIGTKEQPTEATPVTVSGFSLKTPVTQKEINEDGSTVVEIKYTRNSYDFIFDAGAGKISGNKTVTISGKFEETFDKINTPVASRSGWTFGGWELNGVLVTDANKQLSDQTYRAQNVTFTARWISTVSVAGLSTFGDITLNVTDDTANSKYSFTVSLPESLKNEEWTYKWYVDSVYQADTAAYEPSYETLKKGVHTVTVKALYKGMNFTGQKTVTVK